MNILQPGTIEALITSPYALLILAFICFSESSFLFIPPEIMVIPMGIAAPEKALLYGLFISVFSLIGASFGYFLGQRGGKPILKRLFKPEHTQAVEKLFKKYGTKAIIIAAITPIPFQVFTLSAGAFDLNFKRFIGAASIGRISRYMLTMGLIYLFGEKVRYFIEHQLGMVLLLGTIGIIGLVTFYKLGLPYIEEKWLKKSLKDFMFGWIK